MTDFGSMTDEELDERIAALSAGSRGGARAAAPAELTDEELDGRIAALSGLGAGGAGGEESVEPPLAQGVAPAPVAQVEDARAQEARERKEIEWMQRGVVKEGDTPFKKGLETFLGSFWGRGRLDAMDEYRTATRGGGRAGAVLGYLSDLGNAFWEGLLGGGAKIAEAAGRVVGSDGLVEGARGVQEGLRRYLPTDMTDTAPEAGEDGRPAARSWGARVAEEGKNVMRMAGEFAPAAVPGAGGAYYANALVGAGAANTGFGVYEAAVANAERSGLSKKQAVALGVAAGAIDGFANAFLMGKFKGKAPRPADARFFQSFIKRQLAGAAKTAGVMGASAGAQTALMGLAESGELDVEATGNAAVDSAIQGAMFHVLNEALHAPVKWSTLKMQRRAQAEARDRAEAEADKAATEEQIGRERDEFNRRRAEEAREEEALRHRVEAARAVLGDPQGMAKFAQQNPELALDLMTARRRNEDVDLARLRDTGVNGIGELAVAFQTQGDANAFADRLLLYMDDARAAERQREAKARGDAVERGERPLDVETMGEEFRRDALAQYERDVAEREAEAGPPPDAPKPPPDAPGGAETAAAAAAREAHRAASMRGMEERARRRAEAEEYERKEAERSARERAEEEAAPTVAEEEAAREAAMAASRRAVEEAAARGQSDLPAPRERQEYRDWLAQGGRKDTDKNWNRFVAESGLDPSLRVDRGRNAAPKDGGAGKADAAEKRTGADKEIYVQPPPREAGGGEAPAKAPEAEAPKADAAAARRLLKGYARLGDGALAKLSKRWRGRGGARAAALADAADAILAERAAAARGEAAPGAGKADAYAAFLKARIARLKDFRTSADYDAATRITPEETAARRALAEDREAAADFARRHGTLLGEHRAAIHEAAEREHAVRAAEIEAERSSPEARARDLDDAVRKFGVFDDGGRRRTIREMVDDGWRVEKSGGAVKRWRLVKGGTSYDLSSKRVKERFGTDAAHKEAVRRVAEYMDARAAEAAKAAEPTPAKAEAAAERVERAAEIIAEDVRRRTKNDGVTAATVRKYAESLVKMIDARDADGLRRRFNGMNAGSVKAFEALTGVRMPSSQRGQHEAVDRFCGVTPEAPAPKAEADAPKAEAPAPQAETPPAPSRADTRRAVIDEGRKSVMASPNAKVYKTGKAGEEKVVYTPKDGGRPFTVGRSAFVGHTIRDVNAEDNAIVGRHLGEALDASSPVGERSEHATFRIAPVKVNGEDAHVLFKVFDDMKTDGMLVEFDVLKVNNTKKNPEGMMSEVGGADTARAFEVRADSVANIDRAWQERFKPALVENMRRKGQALAFTATERASGAEAQTPPVSKTETTAAKAETPAAKPRPARAAWPKRGAQGDTQLKDAVERLRRARADKDAAPEAVAEADAAVEAARAPDRPFGPPKPRPNAKTAAKIVGEFVSKDKERKALLTPYHDKESGVVVASDGRILIATRHGLDPDAKNAEASDALAGAWKRAVPADESLTRRAAVNPSALAKACAEAVRLARATGAEMSAGEGRPVVVLRFGDMEAHYDAEHLGKFARAMEANGITEVRAGDNPNSGPLVARNGETTILQMPLRRNAEPRAGRHADNDRIVVSGESGRVISAPERTDTSTLGREYLEAVKSDRAARLRELAELAKGTSAYGQIVKARRGGETDAAKVYGEGWEKAGTETREAFEKALRAKTDAEALDILTDHLDAHSAKFAETRRNEDKTIARAERRIAAEDALESLVMRRADAEAYLGRRAGAERGARFSRRPEEDGGAEAGAETMRVNPRLAEPSSEGAYADWARRGDLLYFDKEKAARLNLEGETDSQLKPQGLGGLVKTPEDVSSDISTGSMPHSAGGVKGASRLSGGRSLP